MSLRDVVRILFARGWSILFVAAALEAGIAVGVFWLISPTYESKARLYVDVQSAALTTVRASQASFVSDLDKIGFVETVVQEIETPRLIEDVVKQLHLAETRKIGRIEAIKDRVIEMKYSLGEYLGLEILKKRRDPFADSFGAVTDNLDTNRLEGSAILQMTYRAKDPIEAQNTLQAIVRRYIEFRNAFVQEKATGSSGYLKKELDRVKKDMARIEGQWLALTKSERFKLFEEALPKDANGGTDGDDKQVIGLLTNNRAVEELMLSVVNMQTELERLLSDHTESHPMVERLRRMIAAYTEAVNRAPDIVMETQRLLRELAAANKAYGDLQAAYQNTIALESEDVRRLDIIKVIQEPTLPFGHASPKRTLALTAGLVLSVLVAIALSVIAEFSADAVLDPDDVRDKLGLPYLTSLRRV